MLFCLGIDLGFALAGFTVTSLMSLSEPQIRLAILGSAMVSLYVIAASEGGGSTMVPYEGTRTSTYLPLVSHTALCTILGHPPGGRQTTAESGGYSVLQGFRSGWLTLQHLLQLFLPPVLLC